MSNDLLTHLQPLAPAREIIGDGAVILRRFAQGQEAGLIEAIDAVAAKAAFRQMVTPGGYQMSVAMTSCGRYGWVTDRHGYRYATQDPQRMVAWPEMPATFLALAQAAAATAGYSGFQPNSCLINRYETGSKLSLHQDRDEQDLTAPIVSVSLGIPAVFQFGGIRRTDLIKRYRMESGDIVVWGGPTRLAFHGIGAMKEGAHPLTGGYRYNLTFRKAG